MGMTPGFNPLVGWQEQTGVNQQSPLPQPSPIQGPGSNVITPPGFNWGDPNQAGWGNPLNQPQAFTLKNLQRSLAGENVVSAQLRNLLGPQFANLMMGYGGQAANVFGNFANLGSPFYQQKQRASWEQGTRQASEEAGQARQRLSAQGYGFTPSGVQAGMIGGMATGTGRSLSEQFLQNLFQNEQLQMAGAGGMAQLAALFNPTGLMSANAQSAGQMTPTAGQTWMPFIQSLFGGASAPFSGNY